MNREASPNGMSCDYGIVLRALGIFLLALAVYWPALRGDFVWDDGLVILKNPLVTGKETLATVWFKTDFPLSMTGLWLQRLAWRDNAIGYHFINICLHSLNAILLWRVLTRLKIPGALVAALLFTVHPVCVGSVAWISEFKNTLSLGFFLACISCWLRFDGKKGEHPTSNIQHPTSNENAPSPENTHWKWYGLSLLAFLLALLSKTSTVMLPVVLLLCVWWKRGIISWNVVRSTLPFFALSLCFGLMTIRHQQEGAIGTASVQTENYIERILLAGKAVWFYLGKAILPLNLNAIYPTQWEGSVSIGTCLPLLLLGVVFGILWYKRASWGRHALFAFGFFAVNLLPVLGILDMYFLTISRVSDHFQYISLMAVAAVAGVALYQLPLLLERVLVPVAIALISVAAVQRSGIFSSEEKLWQDTLAKNPRAWLAHNNMGVVHAESGDMDEAMKEFELSLQFNPQNSPAHINMGRVLSLKRRFTEAETHFQQALEIKPRNAEAHKAYAISLAAQRRFDEAIQHFEEALRIEQDRDTRRRLAGAFYEKGDTRNTISQYREIVAAHPNSPEDLNNLAWLLATSMQDDLRNGAEAIKFAEKACQLTTFTNPSFVGTLAAAYAEVGRFDDAVKTGEQAIRVAEAWPDPASVVENQQFLELYKAGKPYREPVRGIER